MPFSNTNLLFSRLRTRLALPSRVFLLRLEPEARLRCMHGRIVVRVWVAIQKKKCIFEIATRIPLFISVEVIEDYGGAVCPHARESEQ